MMDRATLQKCVVIIAVAYEESERRGLSIEEKARRMERGVLDVISAYEQAKGQ